MAKYNEDDNPCAFIKFNKQGETEENGQYYIL